MDRLDSRPVLLSFVVVLLLWQTYGGHMAEREKDDHHLLRASSDTEFARNVWSRSGFCRWRRVAECEKKSTVVISQSMDHLE